MIDSLESIARRYREIEAEMARPEVATDHEKLTRLAREQRTLREIVEAYEGYRRARNELDSARELLKHEKDSEMQEYLRSEERRASEQMAQLEERLKVLLLPKDPNDDRDVVVDIQDEKSQLQNKEKAMRVLRARLYEMKLAEQQDAIRTQQRGMVRGGNRSEKIRTYNFKDNRVTDHRINLTLHKLDRVMQGDLDDLVNALIAAERAAQLNGGPDSHA